MRLSILFLIFILLLNSHSQKPDSVQIDGEWLYIYPQNEPVEATYAYLVKAGLIDEEFDLYRTWWKQNDPRKTLIGDELIAALKKELIDKRLMTIADYEEERASFSLRAYRNQSWVYHRRLSVIGRQRLKWQKRFNFKHPNRWIEDGRYNELLPCINELPDGKYIQYFDLFFDYGKASKTDPIETRTAALFSLKDNQLNGTYLRLNFFGDTLTAGSFLMGRKEGRWTGLTYYFNDSKYDQKKITRTVWTYHDGKPDGYYKLDKYDRLQQTGSFATGRHSGVWMIYDGDHSSNVYFDLPATPEQAVHRDELFNPWENPLMPDDDEAYLFRYRDFQNWDAINFDKMMHNVIYMPKTGTSSYLFSEAVDNEDFFKYGKQHKDSMENYSFQTFLRANRDSDGQPVYRYVYRPDLKVTLGATFYDTGTLRDTVGFDETNSTIYRQVFDRNQKLYYTATWDTTGKKIEEHYFSDKVVIQLEGLPVERSRSNYSFLLKKDGRTTIGSKQYGTIEWSAVTKKRINENFVDTAKMEEVEISYNYAGDTAYYDAVKTNASSGTSVLSVRSRINGLPLSDGIAFHKWIRWNHVTILQQRDTLSESIVCLKDGLPFSGKMTYTRLEKPLKIQCENDELTFNVPISRYGRRSYNYWEWDYDKDPNGRSGLPHTLTSRSDDLWFDAIKDLLKLELKYVDHFDGSLEQGIPTGVWQFYDKKNRLLFEMNYIGGQPSGVYKEYREERRHSRKEMKREAEYNHDPLFQISKAAVRYLEEEYTLVNGKKEGGHYHYNFSGDTLERMTYQNGELHGKQEFINRHKHVTMYYEKGKRTGPLLVTRRFTMKPSGEEKWVCQEDTAFTCSYVDDLPNGYASTYDFRGLDQRIMLKNGKVDGTMWQYEGDQLLATLEAKEGHLISQTLYENGVIDLVYQYNSDSAAVPETHVEELANAILVRVEGWLAEGDNTDYKDSMTRPGDNPFVTKYYPNGKPARHGKLKKFGNTSLNEKTGLWQYYNYDGDLLYTINFVDTLLAVGNHTYSAKGIYEAKDAAGNIDRRAVLSEQEQYNCLQTEYYPVRDYMPLNNPTTGLRKDYFDNGALMAEGKLENGLPVGVWKFYRPDGKLFMVGSYKDGLKEGRWLSGDLSDAAYIGDICLDPGDPDMDIRINQLERDKDITVSIYRSGELIINQNY